MGGSGEGHVYHPAPSAKLFIEPMRFRHAITLTFTLNTEYRGKNENWLGMNYDKHCLRDTAISKNCGQYTFITV